MQQQSMQQSSFTTPSARSRPFQVMSASRSRPDTSILETTGDLEEDKTNGLKMAFLHSCKHDMVRGQRLCRHEIMLVIQSNLSEWLPVYKDHFSAVASFPFFLWMALLDRFDCILIIQISVEPLV